MTLRQALLAVVLLLCLAGCAQPARPAATGGSHSAAPSVRSFTLEGDVMVSGLAASGAILPAPTLRPCLQLMLPAGSGLVAGGAVATWTAQTPAAQVLDLLLVNVTDAGQRVAAHGSSGVAVRFNGDDLGRTHQIEARMALDPADSTAFAEQSVHLSVDLVLQFEPGIVMPPTAERCSDRIVPA